MLSIPDSAALERALTLPLDPPLEALLLLRRDQLGGEFAGHARFVVIQPRDLPRWVEEWLGWSIFQNAATGAWWGDTDYSLGAEYIVYHPEVGWEVVFQFTDDFTHVVIVPDAPGVHRDFLEFCRAHALQRA